MQEVAQAADVGTEEPDQGRSPDERHRSTASDDAAFECFSIDGRAPSSATRARRGPGRFAASRGLALNGPNVSSTTRRVAYHGLSLLRTGQSVG